MNYTQNRKIMQVTEATLVVGVDIGSQWHYARVFDWRGIELTRRVFRFSNDLDGYVAFEEWVQNVSEKSAKMDILIGCEPTGHYWFTFGKYVKGRGMKLALVNPYHVKQRKEMDDNSPHKTDQKDPKTIAKLVTEGRYSFPYIPEGIYAELREAISVKEQIVKALNATSNRIQRWLKIYFPEYLEVYKVFDSVSGLAVLKKAPLPKDVVELGVDGIVNLWREKKLCAVGKKRALTLVAAAKRSIGLVGGNCARLDLQLLLEDYSEKKGATRPHYCRTAGRNFEGAECGKAACSQRCWNYYCCRILGRSRRYWTFYISEADSETCRSGAKGKQLRQAQRSFVY